MPQFDYLIIFCLIFDLTIALVFYYILIFSLNIKNLTNIKFRKKIAKFTLQDFYFNYIYLKFN